MGEENNRFEKLNKELKEVKKRLQIVDDLMEAVPISIIISTPEGNLLNCNSQTLKIFKYNTKEEFLAVPALDLYFNPDDREKFQSQLEKGDVKDYELNLKRKDGVTFWASLNSVSQIVGDQVYFINSIQDITERKKMENLLKESEERYRKLTEQSLIGVAIIQDNVFKYVNQRYAEIGGYTVEEMINWQPGEFIKTVYPDDRELVMEQSIKKQHGNEDIITQYTLRALKKTSEIIWLELYSKTIMYERRPAVLITLIDITSRKQAELKLKKSEEKYRKAYNRADFYKDLFAHDMSNLLQNINSSTELLKSSINNDNGKTQSEELLKIITNQIERGSSLITNVRKLSSIDEGEFEIQSMYIQEILDQAINHVSTRFKENGITINNNLTHNPLKVLAGDLLIDVFENILTNGALHNNSDFIILDIEASEIAEKNEKFIKIAFLDNGVGIGDDIKENVFNRASKKDKSTGGMGIGLSLVKKIVDEYGGKIWVENKDKGDYTKGSVFVIMLRVA